MTEKKDNLLKRAEKIFKKYWKIGKFKTIKEHNYFIKIIEDDNKVGVILRKKNDWRIWWYVFQKTKTDNNKKYKKIIIIKKDWTKKIKIYKI